MVEKITDLSPLPLRPADGHKGTFGSVGVVGGSVDRSSGRTMLGAPVLSALASLRAGAGAARLAMPEGLLACALAESPVLMGVALPTTDTGELDASACAPRVDELADQSDAMVVGPGMGVSEGSTAVVLRAIGGGQEATPVVLDADGLNALAGVTEYAKDVRAPCVLTPHVGEFGRLAGPLGITTDWSSDTERVDAAADMARRLGAVVVLKSSATVVTDGLRAWTHTGNDPRLATAGAGDVLAGVIASLIAQHHRPPVMAGSRTVTSEARGGRSLFELACRAVRAHAGASHLWGEAHGGASGGMLASDLLRMLPEAVEGLR